MLIMDIIYLFSIRLWKGDWKERNGFLKEKLLLISSGRRNVKPSVDAFDTK